MARIVLISPYLKGGQNAAKLAQRTRYVATRPGVELLTDVFPLVAALFNRGKKEGTE